MLDPQVCPEEIMSREVGLGCESLTSFASVVAQQQCYGHCPCDSSAQQLKEQLRSTLAATQWRGYTALTFWLFWRRSTASSVFRVGARGRAFTLSFRPLPPPPPPPRVPVPNKQPRSFCGRKAKRLLLLSWAGTEREVSGAEQEHSPTKAKVKHECAWSPDGWATVMCSLCARPEISPESDSVQTLQKSFRVRL